MAGILVSRLFLSFALIVTAGVLGACSRDTFNKDMGGFQGFKFFTEREDTRVAATKDAGLDGARPLTPEDFVDAEGRCAGVTPVAEAGGADSVATAPPVLLGGVALGMSECDVVRRAGAAGKVEMGAGAANERTVALTYLTGPAPGIYRFSEGRLREIERVAAPPPPPKVAKQKRPAKKPARPPA